MIKFYDTSGNGYIVVEVSEFYCNDYHAYFAKTGKDTYLRDFAELFYTVQDMQKGSQPTDDGNLLLTPEEKDELIAKNPAAEKWIRPFLGAKEFIQNIPRYCLWLEDCPPNELRKMPLVYQRVEKVREFRLASKKAATRRNSATSWLFQERRQPKTDYLLVSCVSSELREYIPIGCISSNVICSDANHIVMAAYDFSKNMTEAQMKVAFLNIYQRLKNFDELYKSI